MEQRPPLVAGVRAFGFTGMLALLTIYSVLAAYGHAAEIQHIPLMYAMLGLALVLGVVASDTSRVQQMAAVLLVVIGLAWQALGRGSSNQFASSGHHVPFAVLTVYTLCVSFAHVFRATRITLDKIAGTICVYALIAALWGIFYNLLGPEAFAFPRPVEDAPTELFYYSWVTLSTLGYGDITPIHPLARVAANIECFAGQFYIAIIVARMVALQLIQSAKD